MQNYALPNFLKPYLWSFNIKDLNIQSHKRTIIFQVLNFGSKKATDWLFSTYNKKEIAEVANKVSQTAWNKKSLRLWSIILGINPPKQRLTFS